MKCSQFQEVDMFNNRNNIDMMAGLTSTKLVHTDFAKFRDYEEGNSVLIRISVSDSEIIGKSAGNL